MEPEAVAKTHESARHDGAASFSSSLDVNGHTHNALANDVESCLLMMQAR